MRVHFIIHESYEAPGAYRLWAEDRNYAISKTAVYQSDKLPQSAAGIDLLVIMGGPQSPRTTKVECPYFDAAAEIAFIRNTIDAGKAVVGVCLGAQLIGEAMGARVEKSPEKEIGKFSISMTDYGKKNKLFSSFGNRLEVGHWHGDMPGLTKECKILAYSQGCPRQIVEYSRLVYGLQCHLEFTPEVIRLMIKNSKDELEKFKDQKFVSSPETLRRYDFNEMNQKLYSFLDELMDAYRVAR